MTAGFLEAFYFFANELEADGDFKKRYAVLLANGLRHARRHERLYYCRVLGQIAVLFQSR